MGRYLYIWAICLIILITQNLWGQKLQVQLHYIDPGIECPLPGGEIARCYSLTAYKTLLKADYELWIINQQVDEYGKMFGGLSDMLKLKDNLVESKQHELEIYMERSDRLQADWNQCEGDLTKERNDFSWPSFGLGIAIGGSVVAVVTAGIVVAILIHK